MLATAALVDVCVGAAVPVADLETLALVFEAWVVTVVDRMVRLEVGVEVNVADVVVLFNVEVQAMVEVLLDTLIEVAEEV
jgi:hypothetical protein